MIASERSFKRLMRASSSALYARSQTCACAASENALRAQRFPLPPGP